MSKKPLPDLERLLEVLADRPRGELSSVLHQVVKIPAGVLEDALARGLVAGTIEPLKGIEHPPLRLTITRQGRALLDIVRAPA
jgi:hypothetical protein